jgi:uncharacterized protein with HEPN domain
MQARDYRLYLDDMLEAIGRIRRHVGAMDFIAFKADEKTVDAVIRNLEVIGEAARNVPEPLRQSRPEAEWRKIVALRNILIHDYFGVNLEIIWDIVQHKLDDLEFTCRKLLEAGPLAGDESLAET